MNQGPWPKTPVVPYGPAVGVMEVQTRPCRSLVAAMAIESAGTMKSARRARRPKRASSPEKKRVKRKKNTGVVWLPRYETADHTSMCVRSGTACTMASVTAHRHAAAIRRAMYVFPRTSRRRHARAASAPESRAGTACMSVIGPMCMATGLPQGGLRFFCQPSLMVFLTKGK